MTRFEINSNGDTAETIIAQGLAVRQAADHLIAMLRKAAPNGRNYQTLPNSDQALQRDLDTYHEVIRQVEAISATGYSVAIRAKQQQEG